MLKKITSIILSVIMILSCISFTVFASDDSVTVTISVTDSEFILEPTALEVEPGTAKAYGYTMSATDHNGIAVDGVTVMDAVVAAHKAIYGDAFTAETASDYLVMSYGFIMKSFGRSTSASGFLVNGMIPNDGIINPTYGTPTGYACDTATLNDGDAVSYYFYQDSHYYSDIYAQLDSSVYEANAKESFNVNVQGYSLWSYGYDLPENNTAGLENLKGVDICLYENGTMTKLGTTDANGNASISLDAEGDYTIVAVRTVESGEAPTILNYATVKVNPAVESSCFIVRIFKAICNFFENIINSILNGVC